MYPLFCFQSAKRIGVEPFISVLDQKKEKRPLSSASIFFCAFFRRAEKSAEKSASKKRGSPLLCFAPATRELLAGCEAEGGIASASFFIKKRASTRLLFLKKKSVHNFFGVEIHREEDGHQLFLHEKKKDKKSV